MERNYSVGRCGETVEPDAGIHLHQLTGHGLEESFQHIGNDDGVAESNAHGTCQRQPAPESTCLANLRPAGVPDFAVGTHGTGTEATTNGIFGSQTNGTEQRDKNQICYKEGTTAIGTQLCGKTPDIGHTNSRTNRGKDESPAAGE